MTSAAARCRETGSVCEQSHLEEAEDPDRLVDAQRRDEDPDAVEQVVVDVLDEVRRHDEQEVAEHAEDRVEKVARVVARRVQAVGEPAAVERLEDTDREEHAEAEARARQPVARRIGGDSGRPLLAPESADSEPAEPAEPAAEAHV